MKKIIGLVLFLSVCAFAGSGGDSLKWSTTVSGLANGDTFDVPKHWKSMIDTVQSIINGRLGNVNLSASAKFDQRKIDSTQTISTDWLYNYTRKILKWNGATPENRNGRGWAFRINDTTANNGKFTIYADSTKMLMDLGEDTLQLYRPLVCSTDVIARHNLKSDDSLVTKGIRATASILGDSLISDKGVRFGNTLIGDSANLNSAIRADRGIFDSIKIGTGSWVKTLDVGTFAMKIFNGTDTVLNGNVEYARVNNNVSISLPFTFVKVDTAIGTKKYTGNTFPDNLRPSTLKTVALPIGMTFQSAGNVATVYNISCNANFKIPASTSLPCTLIVDDTMTPLTDFNFVTMGFGTCNVSYNIN